VCVQMAQVDSSHVTRSDVTSPQVLVKFSNTRLHHLLNVFKRPVEYQKFGCPFASSFRPILKKKGRPNCQVNFKALCIF